MTSSFTLWIIDFLCNFAAHGRMAEGLGKALQKLLQRFESASDLIKKTDVNSGVGFFISGITGNMPFEASGGLALCAGISRRSFRLVCVQYPPTTNLAELIFPLSFTLIT